MLALVLGYQRLWVPRIHTTPNIRWLAVLPLRHADPSQAVLAEGMTYELINVLAGIEALRVTSMTSAMSYHDSPKPLPQIAGELNVDAIVEGAVSRDNGRVVVDFAVVDARTDRQILRGSYQEDARDVLALQNRIATSIAHEIRVKLTPGEQQRLSGGRPPVNPDAWLDYQRGRQQWNKRTPESIQDAIRYFNQAIAKDPSYAQPYAGLADAWALLGSVPADALPPDTAMPKAREAALKAVALDDRLAEAHVSLANVLLSYDWNFRAAEEHFRRGIELNPGYATAHHWYAHYWLAQGKMEHALAEIRQAQLQDPQSGIINMAVGWFLYQAGRHDAAIEQYRTTLALTPDLGIARTALGLALLDKGQYAESVGELKQAESTLARTAIALVDVRQGNPPASSQIIAELKSARQSRYVPAAYISAIYAAQGDLDHAFEWARIGVAERSDYMIYLRTDPWAAPLRQDHRYQALLDSLSQGAR